MGVFRYQALGSSGKKFSGAIDADSLQDAKFKLAKLQILALRIAPVTEREMQKPLARPELLALTREISRLLQAGLPLFDALSALEEKYRGNKRPHQILVDLCKQVSSGHALSEALSSHKSTFDILYISMVLNAEKTGRLASCFEELSQLLFKQMRLRKQVVSSLLYPGMLAVFCLFVFSALLFFVVPSLQELFEGRNLHPFTKLVFNFSRFVCSAKMEIACFILLFASFISFGLVSAKGKSLLFRFMTKLPILKTLFAKIALIRFSRALGTLLEGGLPLLSALAQGRSVMRHPLLEEAILNSEKKVAQGASLSSCFQDHPEIPPLVPRMLSIAEKSGNFSFTMRQIAEIYEEELESILSQFVNLAQPVLLLVLGAIVGFVLLSVLLPLTDVSSFVN